MSHSHASDFVCATGVDAFVMTTEDKTMAKNKNKDSDFDDDKPRIEARFKHEYHVLLSFVNDGDPPEEDKDAMAVNPSMYNHPRFYANEAVYNAFARLPKLLTQPKDGEPYLYRAAPLVDDTFTHNNSQYSISAHQVTDTQCDLVEDCLSGYTVEAEFLIDHNLHSDDTTHDDRYAAMARGRSKYRSVHDPTPNRPRATHAQGVVNDSRRASSVPAEYDETRSFPARSGNTSLHTQFRRESMIRLADAGAYTKTYGVGEGHFSLTDLYMKAQELEKQRDAKMITTKKSKILRDYLKHHGTEKFNVTDAEVQKYFFRQQSVVSCGLLKFTEAGQQDEDAEQTSYVDSLTLGKKTKKGGQQKTEDKGRGSSKGKGKHTSTNLHDMLARKAEIVEQNEDVTARIRILNTSNTHNYARLIIKVNYIDESAKQQPTETVEVNITELNARKEDLNVDMPKKDMPSFLHSDIVYYDVTHPSYADRLKVIFPHMREDPKYFRELQGSIRGGQKLLLFSIPYNNLHWTRGVFSNVPDRPSFIKSLAKSVSSRPNIFVMMRMPHEMAKKVQNELATDFAKQATVEQWARLFKDVDQQQIGMKSITPVWELPTRFSAIPEYSFPIYREFEVRTGGATVYDAQYFKEQRGYSGRAAVVPVEQTRTIDGRYLSYALSIQLDEASLKKPKLQPGDTIRLKLDTENKMAMNETWSATVASKFEWASTSEICIFADRPFKNGEISDHRSLHVIKDCYTRTHTVNEVRTTIRHIKRITVDIKLVDNDKVCKLQVKALKELKITKRMILRNDPMVEILRHHQQLLMCNNPTALPAGSLFDDLPADDQDRINSHLQSTLLPHQLDVLDVWTSPSGLRNRTAVATGVSGTGKTELMVQVALGYTGRVLVKTATNVRRNRALRDYNTDLPPQNPEDDTTDVEDDRLPLPVESDGHFPSFQQPGCGLYDPDALIAERGRVTLVAATNDTVDALYRNTSMKATTYAASTRSPPLLIIRKHSRDTELKAVVEMVRSSFGPGQDFPRTFNLGVQPQRGTVSAKLGKSYMKAYQQGHYKGIRDARLKMLDASEAHYIWSLATKPFSEQPPEVQAAFTRRELKHLYDILRPIRLAKRHVKDNANVISPDIAESIQGPAKTAMDWLDHKASIICTTMIAASEHRFVVFRQPHFIGVEEFGRFNDAQAVGLFSFYPECNARVCVGDWRQLGPQLFCDKNYNPFYHQATISILARLVATGFRVPELHVTQRFGNHETLEICRIANRLPALTMTAGAAKDTESETIRKMNRQLYPGLKADSTVVLLDVFGSDTSAVQEPHTSWTNKLTSIASNDVLRKLIMQGNMKGKSIVMLSPYTGATAVDVMLNEAYIDRLGNSEQAKQYAEEFRAVRFRTIDSFMGEEAPVIILNSVSHPGHIRDFARTAVGATRSKLCMYFVGSCKAFVENLKYDHPLREILKWLVTRKAYCHLDKRAISRMEQFSAILDV